VTLLLSLLFAASLLPAQSDALIAQSQKAKELMAAGRFSEAVPLYQGLVKAMPDNPGLIMNLAMAHHMAGQHKAAVTHFEKALQLQPGIFPAMAMGGVSYLRLGNGAKAVALLEQAYAAQPNMDQVRHALADAYLLAGRPLDAVRPLGQLAESDSSNPKVWFSLGRSYQDLARRSFQPLEQTAMGSAWWFALAAETRLAQNQRASAFYFYRQALAKNPNLRGIHPAIAAIYRDTGHPDWAAAEETKEAALGKPDCAQPSPECLFQAGQFSGVVSAVANATTPEALYWRTRAFYALSTAAFTRLTALPASPYLHQYQGDRLREQRKYPDAIAEFRKALALQPANPELERDLAVTVYLSRDFTAAETLLRALLKQSPNDAELHYLLGDSLFQQQRVEPAIPLLETAAAKAPKMLPARATLGRAYLQAGQPAKAIPHLEASLSIDDDGSLHYQLTRAYQGAGNRTRAAEVMKKYQQIRQTSEAATRELAEQAKITAP